MASYSRLELLRKFRKELEAHTASTPADTLHIQLASVDEFMSVLGFVPRRLPNYPDVKDGRFGYYHTELSKYFSFEDAVSLHNGNFYRSNPFRRISERMWLALSNRIVEQVSLQRTKRGVLVTQKKWVKFCEEGK